MSESANNNYHNDDDDDDSSSSSSGATDSRLIPSGVLPDYLAQIFQDLYEEDGLAVFGKGLGSFLLLATFVRYYADAKEKGLVLVLGLRDGERQALESVLASWGTPPADMPQMITNEMGQSKERSALYQQGGVFAVTSRILIVDLLSNVVTAQQISGILVYHADLVTEQSTEAFIIRIFRSLKTPWGSGFVKAFSESPEGLLSGFAKVEKTLKALHVRKLYLVPRFLHAVREELEGPRAPQPTEMHQPLSARQAEIQAAIAAAVQACVRELKSATKLMDWTAPELSIENCVTTNFDQAISRQLEQDWHRLSPATKQLVQDLRTLRSLFQSLIQYDCVTFWRIINGIKTLSAASKYPSLWLLTPAATALFRQAKERLYRVVRPKPTKTGQPPPPARLQTILEENPKWKLLQQVLQEIHQRYTATAASTNATAPNEMPCTVLVMVKDDRTLDTLTAYLTDGKKRTLLIRWLRFLEQFNDRSRSISGGKEGVSGISEESRLLLEEEGRVRRILFDNSPPERTDGSPKKALNHVPAHLRKRRRIAVERGRGVQEEEDLEREAILNETLESAEHEEEETNKVAKRLDDARNADRELDSLMFQVSAHTGVNVVLKTFASIEGEQNLLVLQDLEPQYVVFYDLDLAFIRSVEIYASLSDQVDPVKIYLLMFEASAEEKIFMKSLEREQSAFERLIHHKKVMPPPILQTQETQEMREALAQGSASSSYMDGTLPLAFDSRKGQGKANSKQRRDIAVDVREFRSSLPSILHQGGMRLAPVTLTVGDFVLSNVHCVERKSISDLFGSFASGRLYTQAEAMCRYYKAPCLLIEFDPSKSFCLQNANELGVEIRSDSVCSKMSLLVMHFPKLRILWSRSPHETLKIFKDLKANHEEVDVEKAMEIGRSESAEALLQTTDKTGGNNTEEDDTNEAAREMLLRLPGVTVHVARRIMEECDSLADLASLSREEIRKVAGPIVGQKLFSFFNSTIH